jgi:O-antigen/teichoic acid export membrane protein
MQKPSFLRHAAVYGFGTLVVNACGFFLVPLYLSCLTPGEYGILELLSRAGEVAIICLLFGGLKQALLSFHGHSGDAAERRRVVGTALLLGALVALLGVGLILVLGEPVRWFLNVHSTRLVQLAVGVVLLEALSGLLMTVCQARLESTLFMVMTIVQFLVRVALNILFIYCWRWGVWGMLAAGGCTAALTTLALALRELWLGGLWPDGRLFRDMVGFALPFVPGGIGFFILHNGERFYLPRCVSKEQIGVYALSYKLALVVGLFSRTPLYMVWNTQMHEAARRPDAPAVFGRALLRILTAYLTVGLALCLVVDELVVLLGGMSYAGAAVLVAPVVLAYYFLTAADLLDAGFYVTRRTGWKTPVMLASTGVMLALYAALIPPYGTMGAALATLGGFVFHAVATGWTAQRVFPVRYEWARLAAVLLLAVGLWVASRLLPAGLWALPAKVALLLAWPVLLWSTGLVAAEEKRYVRSTVGQGVAAVRGWFTRKGGKPAPAPPADNRRRKPGKGKEGAKPVGEPALTDEELVPTTAFPG